jgi:hypothetical protein
VIRTAGRGEGGNQEDVVTSKKWLARAGWFAAGFASALALAFALSRYPPPFREGRFDAIRQGMTRDEVVEVLGCPPGDYRPAVWRHPDWYVSTSDVAATLVREQGVPLREVEESERRDAEEWFARLRAGGELRHSRRFERLEWWDRSVMIKVIFDQDGKAIHSSFWSVYPPRAPRNPVRYAQWWLGW